ncbi:hypothetical protein [Cytobacillus firmus]|uniref:hypothetical protein n=1 Tax=Cytobacillus firmus TaxID=1399 RepID=UPI0018CDE2DA|nr:hypothetical protein [Cytobacillus firmus]MBG9585536.1 hypothetical protein [Cytobacillus firmus]
MKSYRVQAKLSKEQKARFEEIRSILEFEKHQGVNLTPSHAYSKEDKITDSDVIRFLITNYKFID